MVYDDSDSINFEQNFKPDILEKDYWIQMVSRLNEFQQDFNIKNKEKILVNLK